MPESQIAQAVQLLDLMLEHFVDDGHWTRGCYDDGNGGHCLVGALFASQPQAPPAEGTGDRAPTGCHAPTRAPLVHFNDTCCGNVAELRSVILKARLFARDDAERERASAALKAWLLAQIEKKRAAAAADIGITLPDDSFASERLAA